MTKITPELLIEAYKIGVFPMANNQDDAKIDFFDPDPRGIIPLESFHVSRSLRKLIRKGIFKVISAIKIINKNNINKCKIKLDIYGLKFENIKFKDEFIQYKGRLENNERLKTMSKYDCLILPSLTEGLPMTLIESMSIGLPFITTKVGAIEDLLIQNYPYICNFNIGSIKNKINSFINDFTNNKTLVNELISKNNELFLKKFKYSIFENNIKKFIY